MEPSPAETLAAWRTLLDQVPLLAVAFSVDGKVGECVAPLGTAVELGGFVIVDADAGEPIVAQVREVGVRERVSSTVELDGGGAVLESGARVERLSATPTRRILVASIAMLGRMREGVLDTSTPVGGFEEAIFRPADAHETTAIAGALAGEGTLRIGSLHDHPDAPGAIRAAGFSRHTFLCGQSGSGKTYTTGVLLERLRLGTSLPIIVLDPNSDHVHLGSLRPDAHDDADAARYAARGDVFVARGRGQEGTPLIVHFSDLPPQKQARALGLDPLGDLDQFAVLADIARRLPAPYSPADVEREALASGGDEGRRLALRISALDAAEWGIWCRDGEQSIVAAEPLRNACVVADLGSLARPEERTIVAAAVLTSLWERRHEKRPVLVVIDEAHNVVPAAPKDPASAGATEVAIAIAAEGRKFGIHLMIATQRPSKVHPEVVSQCDNLVLLRLNSAGDAAQLQQVFSHIPSGLIAASPTFRLGEVLVAGPIAPVPLRIDVTHRLSPEGGSDIPTDWARG